MTLSGSKRDQLAQWARFIDSNAHVLAEEPKLLFQQAANQADGSAPATVARERWATGSENRPWIRVVSSDRAGSGEIMTLTGLMTPASSCCMSPDGAFVAAGSAAGRVVVWDAETGQRVAAQSGHESAVTACFFSADSSRLFTFALDGSLVGWNTTSWSAAISGQVGDTLTSAALLADGQAILSMAGRLEIWDINKPERTLPLTDHPEEVHASCVSADDQLIATACDDGLIRVSSRLTGSVIANLVGHTTVARVCAFGEDDYLASGGWDGKVCIWRALSDSRPVATMECGARVEGLGFAGSRLLLATGGRIEAVDLDQGKVTHLGQHSAPITDMVVSGGSLVTASEDGEIKRWSTRTRESVGLQRRHEGAVHSAGYSPNGKSVVTGAEDGGILVRAEDGRVMHAFQHKKPVRSCTFSNDGRYLACVSALEPKRSSLVTVWDRQADGIVVAFETGDYGSTGGFVRSVRFTHDGRLLIFGTFRGTVSAYAIEAQAVRWQQTVYESADVADIGPEWAVIIKRPYPETRAHSRDDSGAISLFRCADGAPGRRREFEDTYPVYTRFLHGGNELITGTADGRIILLDDRLEDRLAKRVFPGAVLDVAVSNTDSYAAVCGQQDANVYILDLNSLEPQAILRPGRMPRQVALFDRYRLLVVLTEQGAVEAWDIDRQEILARYPASGTPDVIQASPKAGAFAIADKTGNVELLELITREPLQS